jgi:muramidase (phage lysozyme)
VTPNLTAFLSMVAQCEVGTADKTGYRVLYGGGWFDSYDDHPRQKITAGKYTSTAAGRYQILAGTWDDFIKAEGPHRFDEDGQNLCARWLINRRGATADVEGGRLRAAISKCGKEWASLPGSPYGQPVRTLDYCERVYAAHGGSQIDGNTTYRVERPTVPIETPKKEPAMAALPILAAILPSVFKLFEPRAQAAIAQATGTDPNVAAQFLQDFAGKLGAAVGVPVVDDKSAINAVADITSQPNEAMVRALQDQALDYLDRLASVMKQAADLDAVKWTAEVGGKDAAAARSIKERMAGAWDMTKALVLNTEGQTWFILVMLSGGLVYAVGLEKESLFTGLIGIAGAVFNQVLKNKQQANDYRFDGTKESSDQSKALVAAATKG